MVIGMADREKARHINTPKGWALADRRMVAINFGERFGFCTPGERFVPFGIDHENHLVARKILPEKRA